MSKSDKESHVSKGGEGCFQYKDGSISAIELHLQLTEGVDDSAFRAETRHELLELGLTPDQLKGFAPDMPDDPA